jgi:hypothetical protein
VEKLLAGRMPHRKQFAEKIHFASVCNGFIAVAIYSPAPQPPKTAVEIWPPCANCFAKTTSTRCGFLATTRLEHAYNKVIIPQAPACPVFAFFAPFARHFPCLIRVPSVAREISQKSKATHKDFASPPSLLLNFIAFVAGQNAESQRHLALDREPDL